jgi:polyhydroxyalkanoate synthesis regulator protein
MIRLIKRYRNRKLYDVTESRYVTLTYLAECLRKGDSFGVQAHPDGKDLTDETLANIILAEVTAGATYPSDKMLDMIKGATPPVTQPVVP